MWGHVSNRPPLYDVSLERLWSITTWLSDELAQAPTEILSQGSECAECQ